MDDIETLNQSDAGPELSWDNHHLVVGLNYDAEAYREQIEALCRTLGIPLRIYQGYCEQNGKRSYR